MLLLNCLVILLVSVVLNSGEPGQETREGGQRPLDDSRPPYTSGQDIDEREGGNTSRIQDGSGRDYNDRDNDNDRDQDDIGRDRDRDRDKHDVDNDNNRRYNDRDKFYRNGRYYHGHGYSGARDGRPLMTHETYPGYYPYNGYYDGSYDHHGYNSISGYLEDHIACMNEVGYLKRIRRGGDHHSKYLDPDARLCKWIKCPQHRTPDETTKNDLRNRGRGIGNTRYDDKCISRRECERGYYFSDYYVTTYAWDGRLVGNKVALLTKKEVDNDFDRRYVKERHGNEAYCYSQGRERSGFWYDNNWYRNGGLLGALIG